VTERELLADCLPNHYLCQWAEELSVAPELEKLLRGEVKPKHT
jgi:hypothetical protein